MFDNVYTIATLSAIIVGLFLYSALVPRSIETFNPAIKDGKNAKMIKLMSKLGTELYATLPAGKKEKKPNAKIEALIAKAGDPWGLKPDEFVFFQFITAIFGAIIGLIFYLATSFVLDVPFYFFLIGFGLLGFIYPRSFYSETAKRRDLDFKRQLPEALDLIIISLSGGTTFVNAVRESMPQIQEGVLKEEFKSILNSVDTGRTLNESLRSFQDRAPNESIRTFITAVREANELNVPMVEVLQSRSEASRQEFFSLLHNKTAQLPSKIMMALVPTLIPALMIILVVPSIALMMKMV